MSGDPQVLPVAILCGGRGTRLSERTESLPKALVEVGGVPILWHVIGIYASQGFREFLLLTGYKGEQITDWVGGVEWPEGITVTCLDTGESTETGGRVLRAAEEMSGRRFALTYADGLADVDLAGELAEHERHGCLATMTVIRPELQFGLAQIDTDDRVRGFEEKPVLDGWVNGGFFVFEPEVQQFLDEDSVLEREPLESLAAEAQLRAFKHQGFWRCMDTYKDRQSLEDLLDDSPAPWGGWDR